MNDEGLALLNKERRRADDRPLLEPFPSWCVGIVNHGSYDDLELCLGSLSEQSRPALKIAVYDTGIDPRRIEAMRQSNANANVDFEVGNNRGYAGGANRVLAHLAKECPTSDFMLILNPDVELDSDFSARLIESMCNASEIAIASGKLLRPGRRIIDTAGIRFPRHGRPRDRGSEEEDRDQFNQSEYVDAVSGAAIMIRAESIAALEIDGELFDETFFAYHEDTDLCWRARRLGWRVLYEPKAIGIHGRGWRKERRKEIPVSIRRHSFKNHYLQLLKNQSLREFAINLPWILTWEILRFGFVLLKDRAMFDAYRQALHALPSTLKKRRRLVASIRDARRRPPIPTPPTV